MADKQISELTAASNLTDSTLLVVEQGGSAMKANWGMMKNYISPGVAQIYSSSSTYAVGDYVLYQDTLYRCTTAITTAEAWTAAHWTAAVLGDDVSDLKSAIDNINYLKKTVNDGKYVDSTTGAIGLTGLWGYISYNVEGLAGNTVGYSTKLYNGSSAGLACIATDGSYISGTNEASGTLTIPENCAVINVSYFKQNFTANDVVFNVNLSNQLAKRTIQNDVVSNVEAINGQIIIDADNFEIGDIGITTNGWVYQVSTYRTRTKQGVTYPLKRGDIISLSSYTNARFYLGWKRANGTYGTAGWNLADYTVQEDGDYVINLDPRNTTALTSIYTLLSKLSIKRGDYVVNTLYKSNSVVMGKTGAVKSINHRGYNTVAPENTIPAFKMSRQKGFPYVETDVQFTSDGVMVCLHDASINRTARNSDGTTISGTVNIADITYAQALTYDFGIYKSSFYAGTKIPTLAQFLEFVRNSGVDCYVEIKYNVTYTEAQVKSIVDLVAAYGLLKRTTFISFSLQYLGYIKNYKSDARLGYVRNGFSESTIAEAQSLKTADNEVFIDVNYSNVTDSAISSCVSANIPVEVYTVDTSADVLALNPYISGVTSDGIVAAQVLYDDAMNN